MSNFKGRYSRFLRPLFLIIDLFVINTIIFIVSDKEFLNTSFLLFINIAWILTAIFSNYYKVYRFTKIYRVFSLLFVQLFLISLFFFAYFGLFREGDVVGNQFKVLVSILIGLTIIKLATFYTMKIYRLGGKNYRNVVIIGYDDTSKAIIRTLNEKRDLGYRYFGFFSNTQKKQENFLGTLQESFDYILENNIDEIYCTISDLSKDQVKDFTKFANIHSRVIKLIPNSNELYSKNLNPEYYNNTLVLNVKRLPLDIAENRVMKRVFDIIFSSVIIVFVLSWLVPLLFILIKLESQGPVLFKQKREGLGGYHFTCYKFRSMRINKLSDEVHATKNDYRVTNIGQFIRRTSIDELPQFFNVFTGDMSIVGPRPHMSSLSKEYQKEIDNYAERHAVKPGITGLAQVSGYRGEVKRKSDIKNRVRLDIFYIENWSLFLDIKIILNTIFNVFKGDEKAY